jgi:hypothetical protein
LRILRRLALLGPSTYLLLACRNDTVAASPRSVLAFTHATLIDGTGAPPRSDVTVVVSDGRITAVGADATTPAGAEVIDARGKFIIPGLFDLHSHGVVESETRAAVLPTNVAFGVTSVRVMGTSAPRSEIEALRADIREGRQVGPRLVAFSRYVDGPNPPESSFVVVRSAAEGRAVVDSLRSAGVDFIKTYNGVPRDAFFALAARARELHMVVAGHVPFAVTAAEASDSGISTIEHVTGILIGCSSRELEFQRRLVDSRETRKAGDASAVRGVRLRVQSEAVSSFDATRCEALISVLARNHTAQVPTLVALRSSAFHTEDSLAQDPRLALVPKSIRDGWNVIGQPRRENHDVDDAVGERETYRKQFEIVGRMHRAGVPILVGTDVLGHYVFPGAAVHDELALLVDAGLTPMEAILAATSQAAHYLGADSLGTLAVGKMADFLLLDADPLADIHNTQQICGVVSDGRWIDAAARAALMQRIRDIANKL